MARTRAASSSRSWRIFSRATSNMISPPISKNSSTASPTTKSPGNRSCGISGPISSAPSTRSRTCASPRCWTRLDDMLGPHIYAPREDGGDPRQCPNCGTGKLNLKAGKFGAFVGCSNYPECRYTRPLATDGEASADRILGKDPETGLERSEEQKPE